MINLFYNKGLIKNIIGVDLDEERVNQANSNFPYIDFRVEDIYDLKILDNLDSEAFGSVA